MISKVKASSRLCMAALARSRAIADRNWQPVHIDLHRQAGHSHSAAIKRTWQPVHIAEKVSGLDGTIAWAWKQASTQNGLLIMSTLHAVDAALPARTELCCCLASCAAVGLALEP